MYHSGLAQVVGCPFARSAKQTNRLGGSAMAVNSSAGDGAITVLAVGDVFLDRPEPAAAFDAVRDVLAAGDVVIGNCEGAYADEWERAPSSIGPVVSGTGPPRTIA